MKIRNGFKESLIYKILDKYYLQASDNLFVFITYLVSPFVYFFISFGGFKLFSLYYLIITIVVCYRLKKINTPFVLTYLFTLQFLSPAKSYPVIVVSQFKDVILDYKTGYIKDYALNTANVFLLIIIFLFLRN